MRNRLYSEVLKKLWLHLQLGILTLFVAVFFIYPYLNLEPPPILDLSREPWTACFPERAGDDCVLEPVRVPKDMTFLEDPRFAGWIRYSVEFETPPVCLPPQGACSLYIAELGDAGLFILNGKALPEHGKRPPHGRYARHYPVDISIPSDYFKPRGKNRLDLSAYSFKNVQAGIRKGPVGLFSPEDSFQLSRIRVTQNIVIPLASAAILFLLALTTHSYLVFVREQSRELRALIRFCVAMTFFLISFSGLPREFFPVTLAGFLHFVFRFFSDIAFFELARKSFFPASPGLRKVRYLYGILWLAYPALYLLQEVFQLLPDRGFGYPYLVMRASAPLLVLPHIVALAGAWRMEQSSFRDVLVVVFSSTLIFQLNDVLVFHAIIAGNYFVEFYGVAIAFAMGLYLVRNQSQQIVDRTLALKTDAMFGAVAVQVAHDIRSPLSALEMISNQLAELPEDKRLVIRNAIARIRDIAHSLKRKAGNDLPSTDSAGGPGSGGACGPDERQELLLSPLLEELVAEKRLEYREDLGVMIRFEPSRESYGLAASIDPREFKRVISNLVNNSVEALERGRGTVEIELLPRGEFDLEISIEDDGCGMHPAMIARLGVRGATFNKRGGSGLGLAHAKETLEAWGGKVAIESKAGGGTRVTLSLPRRSPPAWLAPALQVKAGATVVVFDDDPSIHEVWQSRFEQETAASCGVTFEHLSSTEQFRQFYRHRFLDLEHPLFLVDFEILGGVGRSGLDLVEEFGIAGRTVLVTSRYDDPEIRKRCEQAGIRLLPKSMSVFIPIEVGEA